MNQKINRRDFLKLIGLGALSCTSASKLISGNNLRTKVEERKSPNILILVFDTLSARHMSTFGYKRDTTPNVTKFAGRSYVYNNHYSAANFTSPGTASLLTGVYPWFHQALHPNGKFAHRFLENNIFSFHSPHHFISTYTHNPNAEILINQAKQNIDELVPMNRLGLTGEAYSERLFPRDFTIAFWSENTFLKVVDFFPGSLFFSKIIEANNLRNLRNQAKIHRDKYPNGPLSNHYGMHFLLEDAIDWIQEKVISLPDPFLSYYHLWPPHAPYRPSIDFIDIFENNFKSRSKPEHLFSNGIDNEQLEKFRRQYDEHIAFVDSEFGRLINFLEKEGIMQNTIVILTSDHGELFERGIKGHNTPVLYQDLLRVPLLISLPNQIQRKDIYSMTSSIDVLPTLLMLTGNQIPDGLHGRVLPGFFHSDRLDERRIYALEAKSNSKFDPLTKYTLAMIEGNYKLIRYQYPGLEQEIHNELFNLDNDPEELENLFSAEKSIADEMMNESSNKINDVNLKITSGHK